MADKKYFLNLGCMKCGQSFPNRETGEQEYMEHLKECNNRPDEVHRAHNEKENKQVCIWIWDET